MFVCILGMYVSVCVRERQRERETERERVEACRYYFIFEVECRSDTYHMHFEI